MFLYHGKTDLELPVQNIMTYEYLRNEIYKEQYESNLTYTFEHEDALEKEMGT